jgi:hypothetical protein
LPYLEEDFRLNHVADDSKDGKREHEGGEYLTASEQLLPGGQTFGQAVASRAGSKGVRQYVPANLLLGRRKPLLLFPRLHTHRAFSVNRESLTLDLHDS